MLDLGFGDFPLYLLELSMPGVDITVLLECLLDIFESRASSKDSFGRNVDQNFTHDFPSNIL